MNKTCSMCKTVKDISMFFRDKNRLDGRKYSCKECSNIMTKRWRKNNPDKYKQICNTKRTKEKAIQSKYRSRKNRHDISNHYIRELITMHSDLEPKDISDELVKAHRMNLKLKRKLELTKKLKPPT